MKKAASLAALIGTLGLLCYPQAVAEAMRQGLHLCAESLIPALFPFLTVSSLLIRLGFASWAGRFVNLLLRPLLGISNGGASAVLLGFVGGYPVGAKAVAELYQQGLCSRQEAQRLLGFCNNSGPAFFIGVVGPTVFHSTRLGVWLYLIHLSSALLVGILLPGRNRHSPLSDSRQAAPSPAQAFSEAVTGSAESMLRLCAFVLFFKVLLCLITQCGLLSLLCGSSLLLRQALTGCLELTAGVVALPDSRAGFLLASALCGWGGLSVHCQTAALLEGSGLSLRWYWWGKMAQALLSLALAALLSPLLF